MGGNVNGNDSMGVRKEWEQESHSRTPLPWWSQGNLTWWNSKLETVKMISTPRKINAILLNININQPKLATSCAYKLATHWRNFMKMWLAWVKIL